MGFDTAFLEERGIVPCVAVFDLLRNRQVKGLHSPAPSGRAGGDGAEQLTGKNSNSIDCCLIYYFWGVFEAV